MRQAGVQGPAASVRAPQGDGGAGAGGSAWRAEPGAGGGPERPPDLPRCRAGGDTGPPPASCPVREGGGRPGPLGPAAAQGAPRPGPASRPHRKAREAAAGARGGGCGRDRAAPAASSGSLRARRQRGHVRAPCARRPRRAAPRAPFINSPPAAALGLGAGAREQRRRPGPPRPGRRRRRRHAAHRHRGHRGRHRHRGPDRDMGQRHGAHRECGARRGARGGAPAPAHLPPPQAEPDPALDRSALLLLLLLALLAAGSLVVLAGALLLGRRCWAGRRPHRALEELEKGTGAYLDPGPHAAPEPECPEDAETERFLSTSSTGRRVSFNEAALFEQGHKAQDKGRRYTLTEGDFHHLKKARLSHLHLPPLKIVTIHECDPGEAAPHAAAPPKAIFQPAGKALTGRSGGPSSALPGDPYNSAAGSSTDVHVSPSASSGSGDASSLDSARSRKPGGPGASGPGEGSPSAGAGPVLQFFTRLRRHASLDGASPYFRVKKWKLEASQRASSLDTRGSPKRHHFQRQRAASESTEPEGDTLKYIRGLPAPAGPAPALRRLVSAEAGAAGGASPEFPPDSGGLGLEPQARQEESEDGEREAGPEPPQTPVQDIWSLRASLELHAASSDHSSSGNDRDSVRSADSSGSGGPAPAFPPASPPAPPLPRTTGPEGDTGPRRLLQMDSGYASIEGRGAGEDGPLGAPDRRCSVPDTPAPPSSPHAWPRRPRRDYSVDEKTDALFHEFLRHDPHFDGAPQPRHRARAHPHPRKQWPRGRQHSDPGARPAAPPGAPRASRAPLRRGDSVDCPPDGRLPDDPAGATITVIEEEPGGGCPGAGPREPLLDKLAVRLDDSMFPARLGAPAAAPAPALAVAPAPTSPDHSPA
ncbi:voltage-dependent calcium channel beta subunit-associated regulatory protein isoform X2 [Erinaceus europaeus]|uniref:Voltage-dependent calcium channel beta subunit-associated regulatory protein isoform X2 n=1 Tax=Erinaceus europaeus TaxID=9365 RepID=A0ABM3WLL1_ERIEU|nr:voltage-dependent calcium channel beta subunit-associated regulatory protein isoform X2 [Erinaceus europaeus]